MCVYVCDLQWTRDTHTRLEQRLQHLTFVLTGCRSTIELTAPESKDHTIQLTSLQQSLQAFTHTRFRREPTTSTAPVMLSLSGWCFNQAMFAALAALPHLPFPVVLQFSDCKWPSDDALTARVPAIVPSCYTHWELALDPDPVLTGRKYGLDEVEALCAGAKQCGRKLSLRLVYRLDWFCDALRSITERYVEREGLGGWAEIEWCPFQPLA